MSTPQELAATNAERIAGREGAFVSNTANLGQPSVDKDGKLYSNAEAAATGMTVWREKDIQIATIEVYPPGAYGIHRASPTDPDALVCGTCGNAWKEDITPAGRCPWEHEHDADEPNDAPLRMEITRDVQVSEVEDLIGGTGMLSYPWWIEVDDVHDIQGRLIGYTITHWQNGDEGQRPPVSTTLTLQQIVTAASRILAGLVKDAHIDSESAHDMARSELGYADAAAADTVIQVAVYGKVIYG